MKYRNEEELFLHRMAFRAGVPESEITIVTEAAKIVTEAAKITVRHNGIELVYRRNGKSISCNGEHIVDKWSDHHEVIADHAAMQIRKAHG